MAPQLAAAAALLACLLVLSAFLGALAEDGVPGPRVALAAEPLAEVRLARTLTVAYSAAPPAELSARGLLPLPAAGGTAAFTASDPVVPLDALPGLERVGRTELGELEVVADPDAIGALLDNRDGGFIVIADAKWGLGPAGPAEDTESVAGNAIEAPFFAQATAVSSPAAGTALINVAPLASGQSVDVAVELAASPGAPRAAGIDRGLSLERRFAPSGPLNLTVAGLEASCRSCEARVAASLRLSVGLRADAQGVAVASACLSADFSASARANFSLALDRAGTFKAGPARLAAFAFPLFSLPLAGSLDAEAFLDWEGGGEASAASEMAAGLDAAGGGRRVWAFKGSPAACGEPSDNNATFTFLAPTSASRLSATLRIRLLPGLAARLVLLGTTHHAGVRLAPALDARFGTPSGCPAYGLYAGVDGALEVSSGEGWDEVRRWKGRSGRRCMASKAKDGRAKGDKAKDEL